MKWPWRRRRAAAEAQARLAEKYAAETQRDWDEAHEVAGEARRQRELNGWTSHVLDLFLVGSKHGGSR